MPSDDRFGLDNGQCGSPVGPEPGEPDPERSVTGPQPGAFDGLLVDGDLLSQSQVFGSQHESGRQECSHQKVNRLDDAQGKVSQGCRETAILPQGSLGIKPRNSLTPNEYGIISRHRTSSWACD